MSSPLRLLTLLGVVIGLLVVLTVAVVDGPGPSPAFQSLVSVHDSMIPARTAASAGPDAPPVLTAELSVQDGAFQMASQMLAWRGRWYSVHRIDGQPDIPPQSRTLDAGEPPIHAFDVADLTLVTWVDGRTTVVLASSGSEGELHELARLVQPHGRYVPASPVTPGR